MPVIIDKDAGTNNSADDARYQINNFSNLIWDIDRPGDVISDIVGDEEDAIVISFTGVTSKIDLDFVMDGGNTATKGGSSVTIDSATKEFRWVVHTLKPSGDSNILDKFRFIVLFSSTADDTGTAESGTSTTLTDTNKAWTTNAFANKVLRTTGGTGSGQIRQILSNTATVLTIDSSDTFDTNPAADTVYEILDGVLKRGLLTKITPTISDDMPLTFDCHVSLVVGTIA